MLTFFVNIQILNCDKCFITKVTFIMLSLFMNVQILNFDKRFVTNFTYETFREKRYSEASSDKARSNSTTQQFDAIAATPD